MQRITKQFLAFLLSFLVALPASAIDVNGQLKNAQLEKQASDPTSYEARIYYNTAEKKAKIYNGTAWQNVGSGSGTAGNLVTNGDSEDAAVPSGWGTYDDGASAAAVDGTGGSPSATTAIARTTTAGELISGAGTWKLAKSAADAQGEGWSYAFTIPANSTVKNALNEVSFNYYMSAAPASDLFRVYVYDVTNAALITPSFTTCGGGSTPSLTSTTSPCAAKLSWVATTGTSYRLLIHVASTNATAVNLFVDDLFVGQRGVQVGPGESQWVSYTPTGSWTANTTYTGRKRRVGDTAEYEVSVAVSGTPTSATLTISQPTGETIDSTKVADTSRGRLGDITIFDADGAGSGRLDGEVQYNNTTSVTLAAIDESSASNHWLTHVTQTAPITFGNAGTDKIVISYRVPIAEWASGVVYGENNVSYYCSTGNTWGTTNASATTTNGCVAGVAGGTTTPGGSIFYYTFTPTTPIPAGTIPELQISNDQLHWFAPGTNWGATGIIENLRNDGTNYIGAGVYVNASGQLVLSFGKYSNGVTGAWGGTWYWRIRVASPGIPVGFGLASSTDAGLVSTTAQTLGGRKSAGNTKIRAYLGTNQSVSNGATSRVLFDTEVFDTNSEFDSTSTKGTFTATRASYYLVHCKLTVDAVTVGSNSSLYIYKNSTRVGTAGATQGTNPSFSATELLSLAVGDTVECRFSNSDAGARTVDANGGDSGSTYIAIVEVL